MDELFPVSNLNFPWHNLSPFPPVPSLVPREKRLPHLTTTSLRAAGDQFQSKPVLVQSALKQEGAQQEQGLQHHPHCISVQGLHFWNRGNQEPQVLRKCWLCCHRLLDAFHLVCAETHPELHEPPTGLDDSSWTIKGAITSNSLKEICSSGI